MIVSVDRNNTGMSVTASKQFVCLLVVLAVPLTALADHVLVYRWSDPVDGDVHYSATAPENQPFDTIAIEHAPATDLGLQRRLAEMDEHTDQRIDARKQRREAKRLDAALAAARQQNCVRLRNQQVTLESRPGRRFLIVDADGNPRRMTEDERQKKLTTGRQQLAEQCANNESRQR